MSSSITRAYQESTVRSADAVQLVLMLHDLLIDDLRGCVIAARANDIPARTNQAAHSLAVIDQLQQGVDLERGGEAARNMCRLYALARMEILRAQVNADALLFEQQMRMFISLREAWQLVREQQQHRSRPADGFNAELTDPEQDRKWTV